MTATLEAVTSTAASGPEDVLARIAQLQTQMQTPPIPAALANGPFAQSLGLAGGTIDPAGAPVSGSDSADSSDTSATGATSGTLSSGGTQVTGADIKSFGLQQLGIPYVWGGTSTKGFDCSGLTQYIYAHFGIDLPRTADEQAHVGTSVNPQDAQVGDLLFFKEGSSEYQHVGIYLGNGQMLEAPHTGATVRVRHIDLSTVDAARRILPAGAAQSLDYARAAAGLGSSGTSGSWASNLPAAGQTWASRIQAAANSAGIDPRVLASIVWTESDFDATAKSPAGAIGLGQLMPSTAQALGVNPNDPAQNLQGTATYFAQQLTRFHGDIALAAAAYNAGPDAVQRYGGIPPYSETQQYVQRVRSHLATLGVNA